MRQERTELCARSQEKLALQSGLSTASFMRHDLKLKCFKKKRAQDLTEAHKNKRLVCAKRLLRRYPEHAVSVVWFTDEKQFIVAPPVNRQNDRLYATTRIRKKQLPADRLLCKRSTFSRSVMVSVGVSLLGRTDLIFIDPASRYYRDTLLRQQLLPAIRSVSGDLLTFQQDNAPGPTVPARQLHCFQLRHPTSSVHSTGHQTARTSIRLIIRGLGHFARVSLPLPDP